MAVVKNSKPHWDTNGSFVVALDSRAWSQTGYETLDDGTCGLVSEISRLARLLEDRSNTKYCTFIELTHPTVKGEFIRIPLDVTPHLAKTLWNGGGTLASPTLVLHPDSIEMRIVASRRPEAMAWKDVKAVIGGDPGITNTLATTMVVADGRTVARNLKALVGADEPTCREWLSSRVSDGAGKIETKIYEGTPFIKAVARRAAQIDEVNRMIDAEYDASAIHAAMLKGLLGLAPEARIGFGHAIGVLQGPVLEFFARLFRIADLKTLRRKIFAKIDGIKRSWFGFIGNRVVERAVAHDAGVILEESTWTAKPHGRGYKGPAFNIVLNDASVGRILNTIEGKCAWHGVPFALLPAWHSSTTDFDRAIIDSSQRDGDVFTPKGGGIPVEADDHAGELFARYPSLVAKRGEGVPGKVPRP